MMNRDPDLLKQAILNVAMNAVEAMSGPGGVLSMEALSDGGTAHLVIADTGPGIPPEIQDEIFNLYFSTKDRGSGIGLAMAFRFVQLHDGKIEFSSQTNRGATFRFSFPEVASITNHKDWGLSRTHRA